MNRRGFLQLLGIASLAPLAAKVLPIADWIAPKFQAMEVESYEIVSGKSLDDLLRERAQAALYYQQMVLALSSFGEHRADRLLFDKLGQLEPAMRLEGAREIKITATVDQEWGNQNSWLKL